MKHCIVLAIVLGVVSLSSAGDWPQWRGPYFNGSTDETGLPSHWTTTENIAWSVDLPGASAATPIIWKGRVFISSTDSENESLLAMCLDRADGKVLWRHEAGKGTRKDKRSNFAAPSPVTDGKVVVFFYGNGVLVGFDLEGNRLWSRNIQDDYEEFAFLWTFSSSPTLIDGRLYLQVLQRDEPVGGRGHEGAESYLLAIDAGTGKTIWRHIRPSKALRESREAFSTPIPFSTGGSTRLLVVGGDALSCHDLDSGEELWRWGQWNPNRIGHWRVVPSPVTGEGLILVCPPKNTPVYAIRPPAGAGKAATVEWESSEERDLTSDVPTPAFYDGDFFIL
ncbi:MAG: PQQ-binding-like beta-propeller repeat protein, partial [Planctomycetes bacterium]|nr:PQQ-binding-like beta-propeller repeat protein [Planctomycetota bacterium]